jgi:hypothetical protein
VSDTATETSPDGLLEARFHHREMMHGQWIAAPEVRDRRSGAAVIALADGNLDGSVTWGDRPGCFTLMLRRWPDASHGLAVHCDVEAGTVRLGEEGAAEPLAEAAALIARHFEARIAAARPAQPEPGPSPRRRLRDGAEWIALALFGLAGLAAAMGWLG